MMTSAVRLRHVPDPAVRLEPICECCLEPWPCDAIQLCDAIEQANELIANYLWNEDGESEDWLVVAHDTLRDALDAR